MTAAEYYKYLNSKLWKVKRAQRLQRDGYRCAICGTGKNLQVHHITYDDLGSESIENLLTLCKRCHEQVHESDLAKKSKAATVRPLSVLRLPSRSYNALMRADLQSIEAVSRSAADGELDDVRGIGKMQLREILDKIKACTGEDFFSVYGKYWTTGAECTRSSNIEILTRRIAAAQRKAQETRSSHERERLEAEALAMTRKLKGWREQKDGSQ